MLARCLPPGIMRDKSFFEIWQERGYHVTPVHFFEPIPDTRNFPEGFWGKQTGLPGVDLDDAAFLSLLSTFESHYRREYETFPKKPTPSNRDFYLENGFLGPGDAEVLYSMIRHFRPKRILEIGSGYTTLLMARALAENRREDNSRAANLLCIDPYPKDFVSQGGPDLAELVRKPLEEIPLETFESLGENDILFIDSTHVVRIGGDVTVLFLEILPRLAPGVLVHVHDIFLPEEYPEAWVKGLGRYWNEQYLLQAFLVFNSGFRVIWPGNYMRVRHGETVESAIPAFRIDKCWMGSFWMRRV
jgi:predicted O-methyltransferase YrrM